MKNLFIFIISCFVAIHGYSQASCEGSLTGLGNGDLGAWSTTPEVFGDGTIGYVTICINSATVGTGMCSANSEGIVIRETDGTIIGQVYNGTALPLCVTSTVQDGLINVYDICGTGLSNVDITWETTDNASGGGTNMCDHCLNGVQDEDETNKDCGGADCLPCGPAHCYNGVMDSDETDVDCGGSCNGFGGTACCTNFYTDYNELSVDCGGPCPAPPNDDCSGAIAYTSTGGTGCNYTATSENPQTYAPDVSNSLMDFSTVCDLFNIAAGTFRWTSMDNGVWYTLSWPGGDFSMPITNIVCNGTGVIQAGIYTNVGCGSLDDSDLMGCAMTDQVDMTVDVAGMPAGDYIIIVDGADGAACYWEFPSSLGISRNLSLLSHVDNGNVNLTVVPSSAEKISKYIIEKSSNAYEFTQLAEIKANEDDDSYYFVDDSQKNGISYYRVTEFAEKDAISTSNIIKVNRDLMDNSINVIKDGEQYTFMLHYPSSDKVNLKLIDQNGRIAYDNMVNLNYGTGNVSFNSSALSAGVYTAVVSGIYLETVHSKKFMIY